MKTLREIRVEKGWTQEEMGALLGMHRVLISRIENGKELPYKTTKKMIENIIGRVDWIGTAQNLPKRQPDYYEAEALIEKLVMITKKMKREEKQSLKRLINTYIKL